MVGRSEVERCFQVAYLEGYLVSRKQGEIA